jgi:hypothetical protein
MKIKDIAEAPAGFTYKGYRCTKDCSGHIAGYRWASEKGIDDEYDCPGSGTHPSFWEGCKSKTEGK